MKKFMVMACGLVFLAYGEEAGTQFAFRDVSGLCHHHQRHPGPQQLGFLLLHRRHRRPDYFQLRALEI